MSNASNRNPFASRTARHRAIRTKTALCPTEKIGVIGVDNFPALGKLAALRFIAGRIVLVLRHFFDEQRLFVGGEKVVK